MLVYRGSFFEAPVPLDNALNGLVETGPTALRAYDIAVSSGFLFAVGFEGNQAWQLDIAEFQVQPRYFPMRLFTGKALIGGTKASYDSGDAWPYLAEQPRPRFDTEGSMALPQGITAFDGREPGCLWHRVFLDACIPAGCSVTLSVRAADHEEELASLGWQTQPKPYQNSTGSEIPWAPQQFDTWELLLQQVRGRFLQVHVSFTGTARETPRIHALRVYYPRFSYLRQYLPAVYREDEESASFLDRYLANPEGTLTAIEGRVQDVQLLFDGRSVPAQWLEWLASWMGGVLDESWDEYRRRLFVRYLISIYRERGTLGGLLRMLRLTLDACVSEELFESSSTPAGAFNIRIVESMQTIGRPRRSRRRSERCGGAGLDDRGQFVVSGARRGAAAPALPGVSGKPLFNDRSVKRGMGPHGFQRVLEFPRCTPASVCARPLRGRRARELDGVHFRLYRLHICDARRRR